MTGATVVRDQTVVLVAHGSRDPRAGDATRALARAVAAASPTWRVRAAFLEFGVPHLAEVLAEHGPRPAVVVPLLLTPAYHARTDIPAVIAESRWRGAGVAVAPVLGPEADRVDGVDLLVGALRERLDRPRRRATPPPDAVVLAAAGSRDPRALTSVDTVAARLGASLGVPCRAGYASGIGPTVDETVAALRAQGAGTIAMAAHFLAPGLLYDRAVTSAARAGVTRRAEPLADASDLVTLVRRRVATAARFEPALAAAA